MLAWTRRIFVPKVDDDEKARVSWLLVVVLLALLASSLLITLAAAVYYALAADVAREIGAAALEGNALRNSGIVYFDLGDYGKAIEFYDLALVASTAGCPRKRSNIAG